MVQRNLDPCFYGVVRNGEFGKICFSDLTREEQKLVLKKASKTDLMELSFKLAEALNKIGDLYNIDFQEIVDKK